MQRWQYYVMGIHFGLLGGNRWKSGEGSGLGTIEASVNDWGAAGWELVGVMPLDDIGAHLWFKRPISEEEGIAYLSQREGARQEAAAHSQEERARHEATTKGKPYLPVPCPGCGRTVTAGAIRCGACGASVEPRLAGE